MTGPGPLVRDPEEENASGPTVRTRTAVPVLTPDPERTRPLVGQIRFAWLWNEVYKGPAVSWSPDGSCGRAHELWLGWTTREYKRRGW